MVHYRGPMTNKVRISIRANGDVYFIGPNKRLGITYKTSFQSMKMGHFRDMWCASGRYGDGPIFGVSTTWTTAKRQAIRQARMWASSGRTISRSLYIYPGEEMPSDEVIYL